jgi:Cu-Zn family superoxide dismutase
MKIYVVAVILVAAASAAHAASETITMNSIDANGVGKKIGTLRLSDTKAGLRITPLLTDLPPGDRGFHVHVNPDCDPAAALTARQRQAWQRVAIMIPLTPENT